MSVTKLPKVDAVVIGMGWTGSIIAKELTEAGLKVVGLERGPQRETAGDPMTMHDELRFSIRKTLMQDISKETYTFRNDLKQRALPTRHWGSTNPGSGVGGAGMHWAGATWRLFPSDFQMRSHYQDRYGKTVIPKESEIQDWGVNYTELERDYDHFERVCGTAGKAGNIKGQLQKDGNPFEGPRSGDYPNPPMKQNYPERKFIQVAKGMGLHPFVGPASNATQAYINPYGAQMYPCTYCGFCIRFDCGFRSKATPQLCILDMIGNSSLFELRTNSQVTRINLHPDKKSARSVTYINADGEEIEQLTDLVMLSAFSLNNVRLLLLSNIGQPYDPISRKGVIGRNYTYQTVTFVPLIFKDDVHINTFMGAGGMGIWIDDYNGDNFDHAGLNFVGGGNIGVLGGHGSPIGASSHAGPAGSPHWGLEWKKNVREYYHRTGIMLVNGCSTPSYANHLDLDPQYEDHLGDPLLRITFDFPGNDRMMADFLTKRATEIAEQMDLESFTSIAIREHFSNVSYQSTHNTGGTIMGHDPGTSAVNRYLQSWDIHNLFIMGASVFPQNPSYPPTGTIGALAYWAARAITEQYVQSPGSLVT